MSLGLTWQDALIAATGLHAGFQLTVTVVVYPALADLPVASWPTAHAAHSRRIAPIVAVVYAAALIASGIAISRAETTVSLAVWLAAGGTLVAVLDTALVAGPLHARLTPRDDALVARLLTADRVRCAAALVAFVGALLTRV